MKLYACQMMHWFYLMIWNIYNAGFLQEWLAWAWVWSSLTWWPKIDWRIRDHTHVRHWIKPFQVVGLSSSICDSHMLQTSLLYCSQVQGESIPIVSDTLCQENHTTAWKKTLFQEDAIFPFTEASTPPFTFFSRWSWFSTPLKSIISTTNKKVLHLHAPGFSDYNIQNCICYLLISICIEKNVS